MEVLLCIIDESVFQHEHNAIAFGYGMSSQLNPVSVCVCVLMTKERFATQQPAANASQFPVLSPSQE